MPESTNLLATKKARDLATAEHRLLLRCARLRLRPADREAVETSVHSQLDWDNLLQLAARHGLRPLLHRHLDGIAGVPRPITAHLWAHDESLARRNRAMTAELLVILRAFEAEGIRALPYKGPALAASVYCDLRLREFGDLDILLDSADIPRARAALVARGYAPDPPLAPAQQSALVRSRMQYHLVMVRPGGSPIELHWKTDADYPIERTGEEAWWSGLPSMQLEGETVRAFSEHELLLVLCLHGAHHYWVSLGWLVDVAEILLRSPGIDWQWVYATATRLSCERRLGLGLHLAEQLLEAPLPPEVKERIDADPEIANLSAFIIATLFDARFHRLETFANLRFNLRLYERTAQRLRHLCDSLLAPSLIEWTRWPLPRALFLLYPPLRLARLTGKHARNLFARG